MGDHECRAIFHQALQRRLDDALGFRIEGRGRLVENQDRRIFEQGASDRDALTLPTREQHAAIADHRVETRRQVSREFEHVRCTRRFLDRGRRCISTECDIRADRVIEEDDFLTHERDLFAQALELVFAHIVTIHANRAFIDIIEARQQIHERRLAAAGAPDDGDHLPCFDPERDVFERRALARRIRERRMLELDLSAHALRNAHPTRRLGRLIQELEEALTGSDALLQRARYADEASQRLGDVHEGNEKREQVAHAHPLVDRIRDGNRQDERRADRGHHLHDWIGESLRQHETHV